MLQTMSSHSSRLLTLVSLDNSFFSFILSCIFACLLIQRDVSVCMFQNVIFQNMFYNWTMFMYTQKSKNTNTNFSFATFMFQGIFLFIYTNRPVVFSPPLWRWQTFLKTLWHVWFLLLLKFVSMRFMHWFCCFTRHIQKLPNFISIYLL